MFYNNKKSISKLFFTLPPFLWLLIFTFLPLLIISVISLSEPIFAKPPFDNFIKIGPDGEWIIHPYVENFKNLFTDKTYLTAFINSIQIAISTTVTCLILGYPMAYYIHKSPKKYQAILVILVILPFWAPSVIRAYALITILKSNGFLSNFLQSMKIISTNISFLNSKFAVIVGLTYSYLPFMTIPIYLALERINPRLLEAAQDLGCKPQKIFTKVTLPLSLPGVLSGVLLVFIPAIGEFVIPDLLGGAQTLTIGKVIWNEFFHNRDWPMASAITIFIIFTIILPILITQRSDSRES